MNKFVLPLCLVLAVLGGCSSGLVVAPQDSHSLEQYARGLRYKQEGRYLLAKECFQLAKSTARNDNMRVQADREIAATDRAIKALR